jgi:hypothetical protein
VGSVPLNQPIVIHTLACQSANISAAMSRELSITVRTEKPKVGGSIVLVITVNVIHPENNGLPVPLRFLDVKTARSVVAPVRSTLKLSPHTVCPSNRTLTGGLQAVIKNLAQGSVLFSFHDAYSAGIWMLAIIGPTSQDSASTKYSPPERHPFLHRQKLLEHKSGKASNRYTQPLKRQ